MHMRTAAVLLLVALTCVVRLHADDQHPDFTGSWLVESVATTGENRDRPEGRRGGYGGGGGGGFGRGGGGGFGRGNRSGGGRGRDGAPRGPVADEPRIERGQHVEMTQTDAELTVIIAPDAGGRVVRFPLDGSDGFTAAPDGTPLKTKTSWQGVALVTETRATDKGRSYHARQVRSMDASGRVTIETTVDTPSGKRSVTATLTKRES
jgi:hypothetical protein